MTDAFRTPPGKDRMEFGLVMALVLSGMLYGGDPVLLMPKSTLTGYRPTAANQTDHDGRTAQAS
jgi:hypothetical protein